MIQLNIEKSFLAFLAILLTSCTAHETRLNEIQVIGSHNSYKKAIDPPLLDYLSNIDAQMAYSLEYDHIPLKEQLDLGLRNLEMDVLHDPMGGRYVNPKGLEIVKQAGETPSPYDFQNKLAQPGLKMFHIQDVDFRSHHLLFKEGLQVLKDWSDANPDHTPVIVTINAKDSNNSQLTPVLPFTAQALDSIDQEIKEVFPMDQLITPDRVREGFETLEKAVLTQGWPKLKEVKGNFLFVLDESGEKMNRYLERHPGLQGAVMFVNQTEGNPEAAFRIVNDPIEKQDYIKELISLGYMVRTRADSGTKEARENDYGRFEKAKSSGAQVITTDYYIPSRLFESSYKVIFEDGTYERIKE